MGDDMQRPSKTQYTSAEASAMRTSVPTSSSAASTALKSKSLKELWANAKDASKSERWADAESAYLQILKADPSNKYANGGLGWIYYKWNKTLLAKGPAAGQVVRRNLWKWLHLGNDKTDRLYGLMLFQAKKLAETGILKMHLFLAWWDPDNFRAEHWEKWTSDQKITFDGIAIQVIRLAAKEVSKLPNVTLAESERTLGWVDMGLAHEPDNLWLIYYKGKLLLKLGRGNDAVMWLKSVVKAKLHEGWAWYYLAEAMEESGDPLALACTCKAVAESPLDKSLRIRMYLAKRLLKDKYLEESKALIERIYQISQDFAVKLPADVEDIVRQRWYGETEPADDVDGWIKKKGEEALNIFTAHLPWNDALVGAFFVNDKKKERATVILRNGCTLSVSANTFGLRRMKPGTPIKVKTETEDGGRASVLALQRREGAFWDFTEETEAVVSSINVKKNAIYFVGIEKSDEKAFDSFFAPNSCMKQKLRLGDAVRLRYVANEKNFVVFAEKEKGDPNLRLLKKVHATVAFIAPNRAFGKLDNGVFLSGIVLKNRIDITEDSTVTGISIPSYDRKKGVWGWTLLFPESVENPD